MKFGPVRGREVHVGQHVLLGGIHQGGELGHFRAELAGNLAPLGMGGRGVLLGVGGADPGRDDATLRLAGRGERVAGEMRAAPLLRRP